MINSPYKTPLRYPGGKGKIAPFIEDLIVLNGLDDCILYELYSGGAGASIQTLLSGLCRKVVLNDLDYHIYAFWKSLLQNTDDLIKRIIDCKVDIETWKKQKFIYDNLSEYDDIDIGFSTFFLNRANRSGILYKAGPIGGKDQTGNYKIDARFNKSELISRIKTIADKRDNITIHNKETKTFLKYIFNLKGKNRLIFLDPPYYEQGENLYYNCYTDQDHKELRDILFQNRKENWFLTYDNVDHINSLYTKMRTCNLNMSYTLQDKRSAKEVVIFSDSLRLPISLRMGKNTTILRLTSARR